LRFCKKIEKFLNLLPEAQQETRKDVNSSNSSSQEAGVGQQKGQEVRGSGF
jgi:hypothetical protein